MIERAALLISAAARIDDLDADIAVSNGGKKDIYANVRESVAPEEFKAWRDAVKLRQKRRLGKGAHEAHDRRVWDMLSMLEADQAQIDAEAAVAPVSGPARGILKETALHVRAHEDIPAHNLDTGEIIETLPDWEDLRGRAPDITGDLSSEDFVRKLREKDWSEPFLEIPDLPESLKRGRAA